MKNIEPELQEVLKKLHDIQLPNDSLWWPPAPGRIIVGLIIVSITLFLIRHFYNIIIQLPFFINIKTKQFAIKKLDSLDKDIKQNRENRSLDEYIKIYNEVHRILKKCAIKKYGDKKIASYSGKQWLNFLDKNFDTHDSYFSSENIIKLDYLRYQKDNSEHTLNQEIIEQIRVFIAKSTFWIKSNL